MLIKFNPTQLHGIIRRCKMVNLTAETFDAPYHGDKVLQLKQKNMRESRKSVPGFSHMR